MDPKTKIYNIFFTEKEGPNEHNTTRHFDPKKGWIWDSQKSVRDRQTYDQHILWFSDICLINVVASL